MQTSHSDVVYRLRDGLPNTVGRIRAGKSVHIGFIGGSVTAGAGASDPEKTSWRALTAQWFKRRFGDVPFCFRHAAIGGTDSTYGAFRLHEHLLNGGPVDLLIVEFAVNDDGNRTRSIRAMEGIVRQVKRQNPEADICFLYLPDRHGSIRFAEFGRPQENVANHEEVADYYGLPSIHLATTFYRMIGDGRTRWEELSEDAVHPNDFGHKLYAQRLGDFFEAALIDHASHSECRAEPKVPMDRFRFEQAVLVRPDGSVNIWGGSAVKGWSPRQTCNWSPPADILQLDSVGSGIRFAFTGTAAGLDILAGLDTADIEVSVDGRHFDYVQVYDSFCSRFYRPKAMLLADGLQDARHTMEIRLVPGHPKTGSGRSLHVLHLMINGTIVE